MCSSQAPTTARSDPADPAASPAEATTTSPSVPPHLPLHDAHCHPIEDLGSLARIPSMRATPLVIMATRAEDQHLVVDAAARYPDRVVPAFGWHPWFSYAIYDDTVPGTAAGCDDKAAHYEAVLAPSPRSDAAFLAYLPAPVPLSAVLSQMRDNLARHPTALIGEIGVDRSFRLPEAWGPEADVDAAMVGLTAGTRAGRRLSPYRLRVPHQAAVMEAQLRLAGELGRAVSVHGVQAHGAVFDILSGLWKGHEREVVGKRRRRMVAAEGAEDFSSSSDEEQGGEKERKESRPGPKPFPPRICFHSFSGGLQTLQQYLRPAIPAAVFFSFSCIVNHATADSTAKLGEVVRAVPDNRLLVESDLHSAGPEMDEALARMYAWVCEARGWTLEEGLGRIHENFEEFIHG